MHPIFITGKMPAIMSVAFLSLSGRSKKSAKRRQAVKLKTRSMRTTELDNSFAPSRNFSEDASGQSSQEKVHDATEGLLLKEQNDSTVVNDQNMDENLRIKLKVNDTKWAMHAAEYQVPSGLNVSSVSVNDETEGLEEQMKTPRQNDNIDNKTIQTAIKHLKSKWTLIQTTIKDQGDKIKFLESKMNKK